MKKIVITPILLLIFATAPYAGEQCGSVGVWSETIGCIPAVYTAGVCYWGTMYLQLEEVGKSCGPNAYAGKTKSCTPNGCVDNNDPLLNPPPVEPTHCSNGIKDSGEIGQDCGGPCSSDCKNECPSGMTLLQVGGPETGFYGQCVHEVAPKNGLCPSGYTYNAGGKYYDDPAVGGTGQTYTEAASCKKSIPAKMVPMEPSDPNQTYGYTDSELQAIANGWDGINRLSNLGSQVTYTETVDPVTGDVTIVRTETTTKTDGNGNTTTKTSVKTTVMGADGKIKSETTQEQSDEPSDDPGDYNFPDGTEGWNDDSWIPEEEDLDGLLEGWWATSPIGGLYSQSRLKMVNADACMSMSLYGQTIPFCFNDPALVSGYSVWRGMIIAIAYLGGFFYLVRRGG